MKVHFLPQDITCEIKPNQSVLDLAQENNIFIKSVCGGVPSCAECRVRVIDGEYNVIPPSHNELALIGTAHFVDRRRLSCQLRCFGNITVDLSEQVAKQDAQTAGKIKNRAGQREESIGSRAIKGSILAESQSILGPNSAASGSAPSDSRPSVGALDRAPRGPRPANSQPSRPRQPSQQQPSSPQQPSSAQSLRPPQPRPQGGEVPGAESTGEKREAGPRRRRGGRGRNKNRGGSGGGAGSGPGGGTSP